MVGVKIDYDINCPYCGNHIVHHSFDDMIVCRYERYSVVEHKCEHCKKKFLVSLEDNSIFTKYNRKELYPILF